MGVRNGEVVVVFVVGEVIWRAVVVELVVVNVVIQNIVIEAVVEVKCDLTIVNVKIVRKNSNVSCCRVQNDCWKWISKY